MTVTIAMTWLLALLAGFVLGLAYFGSLWWTVGRIANAPSPWRWIAVSGLVRFGLLAVGLWSVCQFGFGALVAAMIGLWIARYVAVTLRVTSRTLPSGRFFNEFSPNHKSVKRSAHHAERDGYVVGGVAHAQE